MLQELAKIEPALHELPYDEVPQWNLVSFTGFDEALRKAYEAKNYSGIYGVDSPIVFNGLDYADFSTVAGKLRVHRARNSEHFMAIAFSSCNGIRGTYERDGEAWRYIGPSQTMRSCERVVRDKSGKQVLLYTPMVADDWFIKLAPAVKDYDVSNDGQTLRLLGVDNVELGMFTRQEPAE
jgi:hypothetical protein